MPKRALIPVGFPLHGTGLSRGYPAARASGRASISRGHFAVLDEKGLLSKEKDAFRVSNSLDPSVAELGGLLCRLELPSRLFTTYSNFAASLFLQVW